MEKRIALFLVAAMAAMCAWADTWTDTDTGYTWTYRINGDTAEIYGSWYSSSPAISPKPTGAVTIPSTLGGKPVTSIGNYAFSYCSGLTSVTIPDGVTSISEHAFYGCNSLSSVTIPSSVTIIDYCAFEFCRRLVSVTIPNSVTSIGRSAFSGCSSLTSVVIGNGVTSIGDDAFWGCSGLTSVTIPDGVTSIGHHAFQSCSSLTSVTIPNNVTSIGSYAFDDCSGLTSVTIPNSVTSIGSWAFSGCNSLPSVTIPDSVTSISYAAFYGCSGLTSVTIPEGVTSIEGCTFCDCSGLTSVTLPDSVTSIRSSAFSGCSGLTSVTIPNSVTSIGSYAFSGCSGLTSVTIPNSVTKIGLEAFAGCGSITNMVLPFVGSTRGNSGTEESLFGYIFGSNPYSGGMPTEQFYDRAMKKTYTALPNSQVHYQTLYIIDEVFTYVTNYLPSGLKTVVLTGEPKIGLGAFSGCDSLTSITVLEGTSEIGAYAFHGCSGLTKVTFPDSVASIGDGVLYGCNKLQALTLPFIEEQRSVVYLKEYREHGNVEDYWKSEKCYTTTFSGLQYLFIKYPVRELLNWRPSGSLSDYNESIHYVSAGSLPSTLVDVVITGGSGIGVGAFRDCSEIVTITLPDTITNIASRAFYNCSGIRNATISRAVCESTLAEVFPASYQSITNVVISDGVANIAARAFAGCGSLASVTIPDSVTSIGSSAFSDCSRLASATIPDSVTTIGASAFYNCSGLTSVTIPDSVVNIGDNAFKGCNGLSKVTIPNVVCASTISTVFPSAYQSIREVVLPDSATGLGEGLFSGCKMLSSVTIPKGVVSIGDFTFSECSNLEGVEIPYGVKSIGTHAFEGCVALENVTIPDSIKQLGDYAFSGCGSLHRIVLPGWLRGTFDEATFSGNADDFEIAYIDGVGIYVNAHDMDFREPEDCLWSGDMNTSHDGIASARLKGMGQDSESSIELQLDSPGRLSFWWKASSESDGNNVFDYAYLSIDGVPQGTLNKENYSLNGVAIGGKTDWRHKVIDVVGKGSHVIRWTYAKDEVDEGDTGDDCAWLDEVEFTPLAYLSFDIAGGTGMVPAEISELEGTVVALPAQSGFEWEDHVFNGWCDGKAAYAAESQYVVPATNVTFTAQWIAKRFLTFALDGGEGQIPITIKDVPGADITLPSANGISRAKHVFVGWSDGATTYDAGANYRVTDASVEFKAVWQRKEAHVSIVSDDVVNGGTVDTQGATISMSAWTDPSVGTPAIYYTLDGTEPTTSSTRYEGPFFVGTLGDVTVRALAVLDDCFEGKATFSFTRLPYSLRECVAMEGVNVTVGGAAPWFRVTGEGAHDGKAALRSGAIGDGESSCVEMQVRGEAEVSFWWKISSQNKVRTDKHDYLAFSVDGEEVLTLGGGVIDWTNATYAVTGSGRHSLRWTYIKDGADASNEDCAWLDDVVWSPTGKLCAVSFDANGGEVSECERRVREGSSIGDLPVPNRSEHIFEGWFTEAEGGLEVSAASEITDDITYYAHWKDGHFIITFDANGGTGGLSRTMVYGEPLSAPEVSRTGYTFAGWLPEIEASVPASNVVYTAQWTANKYTVSFDANGGTGGKTVTQDYGTALSAPTVTRTGYTFVGWSPVVPTTISADDVTYTAQWRVNQYTVTFDANGGTGGKMVTQDYGTALSAPTVTRTGYAFDGWSPAVPATVPAGNAMYTAQWKVNQYTVTFDANGGTGGAGVPADGLWAYYPLDGNANDASGNGRDLTAVKNDPQPTTDRFGNANGAYVFNGSSAQNIEQYAEDRDEPRAQSIIGSFSFGFWFQTNSSYLDYGAGWAWNLGNYAVYPMHGGVYNDERGQASGLGVKVGVDGIELVEHADFYMPTKLTYQANIGSGWHHIAVTVEDSGCPLLYLDGTFVATGETSDRTRLFRLIIGGGDWGYYTGKVDDLVVYNRALSAAEVKTLYEGAGGVAMSIEYGEAIGNLPSPSRAGYSLDGWFTSAAGGTRIAGSTKVTGNVTYYAHWKTNQYTVTFDANGGTGGKTVTQDYGTALTAPTVTRTGYTFNGWSPAVPATVPGGNATYVARWTKNKYTVTFNANGGAGGWSRSMDYGSAVTAPTVTRTGYTFNGWSPAVPATVPGGNATYVARWTKNKYTVTFNANGGAGGWSKSLDYGSAVTAPTVTRTGYTFNGWSPAVPATVPGGNATYVARWTKNKYTVTFNANGGAGGWSKSLDYGVAIAVPTVTRTGYTFSGWSSAVAKTVPIGGASYTAQWTINRHQVTLSLNGGDGIGSATVDYGTRVGDLPVPSREGYEFLGWFTAPTGGSRAADNAIVTGDMTLYAQWHIVLPELYEMIDGAAPDMAASEYNGYLYDENSGAVKGTVQVKVGKPGKKDGKATVKATVVVGTKKITLKGAEKGKASIASDEPTEIELVGKGAEECSVMLGAYGITGYYGAYIIDGARNIFSSKDKGDIAEAKDVLDKCLGSRMVIWDGGSVSVSIAAKGKVKVSGTLASGAKVSATAVLLVGEEWSCVSVAAPRANLSFVLWLSRDGKTTMVEGLGDGVLVGKAGTLADGAVFSVPADAALWSAISGTVLTGYLPDGVPVTKKGTKWTLPKVGRITMKKGVIDVSKAGENPSGLKLTYKAKDGTFKGSFKVYAENKGRLKATTVNVTGFLLNGIGFGTATIKKVGSVSVRIE